MRLFSTTSSVSSDPADYPEATDALLELRTLRYPHELDPKLKGKNWKQIEGKDKPRG